MATKLFEPIRIGDVQLRNRIVMPPMCTRMANLDGSVTSRMLDYYEARAQGGAGMIIVEYSYIDNKASKAAICQLGAHSDELLPGLSELAEVVQMHGAKAFLQLCHGGGQSPSHLIGRRPLAPSAIPSKSGEIPKELSIEEIEEIVLAFGEAALRAKRAGFNGVEIHGAHGYLINQFLSPRSNKRNDLYGPSFEARTRFPLQVLQEIKRRVGGDFPVGFRLNASDYLSNGITLEETKQFVKMLEEYGASYVHVSAGTYESHQYMISPCYLKRGHLAHLAKEVKSVVNIPVIAVGGINHKVAPSIIENGEADLVAMGRALIADPDLPKKMEAGKGEAVRPCIRCNEGCIGRFFEGKPMRCATNPAVGREAEFIRRIVNNGSKKKVVVIGGGVAGMEAARVARKKGYEVTLLEETSSLGGNVRVASTPAFKEDLVEFIKWYEHELAELQVDVRLDFRATQEKVKELKPDVVVIAVGSEHYVPNIEGMTGRQVYTASEVLVGKAKLRKEDAVAIVGGGLVGVETALYLSDNGINKITVLEMLEDPFKDIVRVNKLAILERLKETSVEMITSARVIRIVEGGLEYLDGRGNIRMLNADAVVLACGFQSKTESSETLKGLAETTLVVGDCRKVGKIIDAVNDAAWAAANI